MKQNFIYVIISLAMLFFISCDNAFKVDFDFINKTDYHIDFYLEDYDENCAINPHETFSKKMYTQPRITILSDLPVSCTTVSTYATFRENPSYQVKISNNTDMDFILSTDNKYNEEINVSKNKDADYNMYYVGEFQIKNDSIIEVVDINDNDSLYIFDENTKIFLGQEFKEEIYYICLTQFDEQSPMR